MNQNKREIPIIYIYLYSKIKEKNKGSIVRTQTLKQIIIKNFICSNSLGGNRKGIPKCYIYDIIKDMINLSLLKKVDQARYELLLSNCTKKLNKFIW